MKDKKLLATIACMMVILGTNDGLRGIFAPLFREGFGYSVSQLGMIVSVSYFGSIIFPLIGGAFLDKWGAKRTLVVFSFALSASEVVLLFGSRPWVLAVGFLCSLGTSMVLSTTVIVVSGKSKSGGKGVAYANAMFFIHCVSLCLGQFVLSRYASNVAVWNAVLIAFAFLLMPIALVYSKCSFGPEEEMRKENSKVVSPDGKRIDYGSFILLTLALSAYLLGEHGVLNYLMVYGVEELGFGSATIGTYLSAFTLCLAIGRLALVPVIGKFGAVRVMCVCLAGAALCYWLVFSRHLLVMLPVMGFLSSIMYPTMTSCMKGYVPDSMKGRATTLMLSISSVFDIVFNFSYGHIVEANGYSSAMSLLTLFVLCAAICMGLLFLRERKAN